MILKVWPWVDLWRFDLKNSCFPNSVMDYANPVQLSSESDVNWQFSVENWWFSKFDLESTFDLLTSKIVGSPIQWFNMQMLFKFEVDRMKNDDFRNLTSRWSLTFDLKINGLLSWDYLYSLVKFHDDWFRIVTSRRLTNWHKKNTLCRAQYWQNPSPLQRLPWIHQIVHFI